MKCVLQRGDKFVAGYYGEDWRKDKPVIREIVETSTRNEAWKMSEKNMKKFVELAKLTEWKIIPIYEHKN